MPNDMTIVGRRIDTAIKHLSESDFENALIQISIAIDSTAKKKYKIKKSGKRMKKFIKEYEPFIYRFATNGGLIMCTGSKIIFNGLELHDIIYKSVRCALLHGDELENTVKIVDKIGLLGVHGGRIIINKGHIDGLLFAIVTDEVNKHEYCDSNPIYFHNNYKKTKSEMKINDLWGNFGEFEKNL